MKIRYVGMLFFALFVIGIYLVSRSASSDSSDSMVGMNDENMPNMVHSPVPNTNVEPARGSYRTLTLEEFDAILSSNSDQYTIVNVHIPYEGEIEGTDLELPYNDVEAITDALPDKDAPIILYCRSGNMSKQASDSLLELGYTNVWDVPGGMIAWESSGRSLLETPQ